MMTAFLFLGLLAVFSYNGLYTLWWKKHWAYAAVPGALPVGNRSEAITNCLAGGDGWRDAAARLGGAFATIASATGLTGGKE